MKQQKEYAEVKATLNKKKIRFHTPFPAKMRVFYPEETVLYGLVEETTSDMAKREFPVTGIKCLETVGTDQTSILAHTEEDQGPGE